MALALGFKIRHLSDLDCEISVSLNRINREVSGYENHGREAAEVLRPSVLLAASELASKVLWQRHLHPQFERLTLNSIHCRFLKGADKSVRVRTNLNEVDRERLLRKLRIGEGGECDMPVVVVDSQDQQVASINCVWSFMTSRPGALPLTSPDISNEEKKS